MKGLEGAVYESERGKVVKISPEEICGCDWREKRTCGNVRESTVQGENGGCRTESGRSKTRSENKAHTKEEQLSAEPSYGKKVSQQGHGPDRGPPCGEHVFDGLLEAVCTSGGGQPTGRRQVGRLSQMA